MAPGARQPEPAQHCRQIWRCMKVLSGVGIVTFVLAQFAYGLSLHNPWPRILGPADVSNFTWKLRFDRSMFRDAGLLAKTFNIRTSNVQLGNCSLVPANLIRSPVVVVLVVKGICVILLRYLSTSVGSYSCRARASEDSITSSARQESDFPVDIGYA
ncbi:hypothetical protein NP493_260g04022 [Ridgeia piscesae]|uniref:Uncharacterized protein n=1 Tax=Ridgeia piscesae TaxID=27915 RepID=A0AAD9UCU0_RIDPI|nr:hypothetical protein NP493_260g04022 [Ridgeia piscesae]